MRNLDQTTRGKYTDLAGIRRNIDNGPFDAVLVMSPENIPYYSGFYNLDLRGLPERMHIVVWPRGGEPAFVVVERRRRSIRPEETFLSDIRGYAGEGLDSMRVVAEVLSERGVTSGRLGVEGRNFPGGHLDELRRLMPDLTVEDAYFFLEKPRLIKTPAEVDVLTRVNRLTEDAIETAFKAAKPGDTERAIAARMQYEFLSKGGNTVSFPYLQAGERTGVWHGLPTDRPIESGTLFKTDFGGLIDGYASDLARTAVMGRASDRQRDIHAKLTEIKHRIVNGIRPEMLASEAARMGIQAYEDLGLEFKWHIQGHSIGLAVHESPQLYTWVDEPILAGMIMMIEIGYSDFPNESFHVEDLIRITDSGAEYITDAARHEKLWEVGV
jgi:Xaa-Pro aminopeptidase